MIIRNEARITNSAVRFDGVGEIVMTHVTEPKPSSFAGKGRLFSHIVLKPGQVFGTHKHVGEFEIYDIIRGEGVYNDNGQDVAVRAGDVTVCADGESHGIRNTGTTDLELVALILFTTKTA